MGDIKSKNTAQECGEYFQSRRYDLDPEAKDLAKIPLFTPIQWTSAEDSTPTLSGVALDTFPGFMPTTLQHSAALCSPAKTLTIVGKKLKS